MCGVYVLAYIFKVPFKFSQLTVIIIIIIMEKLSRGSCFLLKVIYYSTDSVEIL